MPSVKRILIGSAIFSGSTLLYLLLVRHWEIDETLAMAITAVVIWILFGRFLPTGPMVKPESGASTSIAGRVIRFGIGYCFKELGLAIPRLQVFDGDTYKRRPGPVSAEDVVVTGAGLTLHTYSPDPRESHFAYDYPDLESFLRVYASQRIEWQATVSLGTSMGKPPATADGYDVWMSHITRMQDQRKAIERPFCEKLEGILGRWPIQLAQKIVFDQGRVAAVSPESAIVGEWNAGTTRYVFTSDRISMTDSGDVKEMTYTILAARGRRLDIQAMMLHTGKGHTKQLFFDRTFRRLQCREEFSAVPRYWTKVDGAAL